MSDGQPRDVTNHILFEVATEVANRGEMDNRDPIDDHQLMELSSWWYLFGPQIQSTGYNRRVWRVLYSPRTLESRLCKHIGLYRNGTH